MSAVRDAFANLRLVVSAGAYLSYLILPLLALLIPVGYIMDAAEPDDSSLAATGLVATMGALLNLFWWVVAGARLLGLGLAADDLKLPCGNRQTNRLLVTATIVTVALPATVSAMIGLSFPLILLAMLIGAGTGVLCSLVPPWTMAIPLTAFFLILKFAIPDFVSMLSHDPLKYLTFAFLLCLLLNVLAYRKLPRGQSEFVSPWKQPMVLSMQMVGYGEAIQRNQAALQSSNLGWMQGVALPDVPGDLKRRKIAALSLALGPGFARGRMDARTWLASIAPPAFVFWVWTLLVEDGTNSTRILLLWLAVLMSALASAKHAQSIYMLRIRPQLGMHELALLPGLSKNGEAATAFSKLLTQRILASSLPMLMLSFGVGLWLDAPLVFFHLAIWMTFTGMFLMNASVLVNLRFKLPSLILWLPLGLYVVATLWTTLAVMRPVESRPDWPTTAWSLGLIMATIAWLTALELLKRRPHPWLQN